MKLSRYVTVSRRALVVGAFAFAWSMASQAAQETLQPPKVSLTPEKMEVFLTEAKIISMKGAGDGTTNSKKAKLSDGVITHDAHVQAVDIAKNVFGSGKNTELNFKDTYRYNIAAYRVARLLGLNSVPMSVERNVDGSPAAVTWWVDDVLMDERDRMKKKTSGSDPVRFSQQIQIMRVFDALIENRDRNQGNILWTSDWTMWLIDHTRAFRLSHDLSAPQKLERCERHLFEGLRRLTAKGVQQAAGKSLTTQEVEALIARRDLIVKHLERKIAEQGEAVVLFTFP